ncbi:hypothetical protein FQN50_002471 [Emmonsiellopsis sp. PD_5]|nr:hypothetical protein FQN50_002471 [Emmonsiellopsis sp. PD_5]
MSLPPEHIRIKRRREEEPVETLYIQSEIHQSKRRFTDFVFQRVVRTADGSISPAAGASPRAAAPSPGKDFKSPRSVSTSGITSPTVPVVRATAPGAEFGNRRITSRKEGMLEKAAGGGLPPLSTPPPASRSTAKAGSPLGDRSAVSSSRASPSYGVRRFHLAAPSPESMSSSAKFLHKVSGGVQKKRGEKVVSKAVVIEKRAHQVDDARASTVLDDLASRIGEVTVSSDVNKARSSTLPGAETRPVVITPRKRHIINEAEKKWKAEEKPSPRRLLQQQQQGRGNNNNNRAKNGHSISDDPSMWDQNSDQLASELEQFAMQITGDVEVPAAKPSPPSTPERRRPGKFVGISPNRPVLRYPPRLPKVGRDRRGSEKGISPFDGTDGTSDAGDAMDIEPFPQPPAQVDMTAKPKPKPLASFDTASEVSNASRDDDDDKDPHYVYDEFIRRPVHDIATDPRAIQLLNGDWAAEHGIVPRDIGVVVITQEDVHFWDALAESDDDGGKGWDSEDEDSNAEDNPANEYPDEDLSFEDEYDDTNAAYRQYRRNASDEEEFDPDYDGYGYGYGYGGGMRDSDEEY